MVTPSCELLLHAAVVQVADIDFFADEPFPSFDVITMGMILHDWGPQKNQQLIQKVCCNPRPTDCLLTSPTGHFVHLTHVPDPFT